jgi:carbon-monoxide dehydrogenase medium subunit
MDEGRIADVAIALGPVAPRPYRAREAEAYLKGRLLSVEALERAGEIARRRARPRTSMMRASRRYRLEILPILVRDALVTAVERARR